MGTQDVAAFISNLALRLHPPASCILGCVCFVGKLCMYNSLSVCYSGHCETTWTVLVLGPKWPTLCVGCYTSDVKVQVSLYLHSWPSLPSCSWAASLWLTPINAHFTWCNVLPMTVKTSIGHPWDTKLLVTLQYLQVEFLHNLWTFGSVHNSVVMAIDVARVFVCFSYTFTVHIPLVDAIRVFMR